MIDSPLRYEPSLQKSLIDFAACDAGFLFCAFLRGALLFVHTDSAALVYRPHLQQTLALRLLPACASLAHRFTWLRTNDFKNRLKFAQASDDSSNVRHLARRARNSSRAEITALTRSIRKTDSEFEIKTSAFDPIRHARSLEQTFQDGIELSPIEMDIVFKCWADVFSQVMRDAYLRYANYLESRHHMLLESQDHLDSAGPHSTVLLVSDGRRKRASSSSSISPRLQKNPLRNRCS